MEAMNLKMDSLKILQSAEWEVKTAVVMEKLKVGVGVARELLNEKKGSLRKLLEG